jgi:hypothetical protein
MENVSIFLETFFNFLENYIILEESNCCDLNIFQVGYTLLKMKLNIWQTKEKKLLVK